MNQKPLKSIHYRVETHVDFSSQGKISSVDNNPQRYGSPNKLPSLQNICRTIQGEDGTVINEDEEIIGVCHEVSYEQSQQCEQQSHYQNQVGT